MFAIAAEREAVKDREIQNLWRINAAQAEQIKRLKQQIADSVSKKRSQP